MRVNSRNIVILLAIIALTSIACNEGLHPNESEIRYGKGTIKGLLVVKGGKQGWLKSKDSVYSVRAVGFLDNPPKDIVGSILSGKAYINLDSIALFQDSTFFYIDVNDSPKTINYLGIALQYSKNNLFTQRVIGVYSSSGDNNKPSPINVVPFDTVSVRIDVDFENLPPQLAQ